MKLALTLSVIAPSVGGVLIMGHRGTGKSTAVRALADLLPPVWVVRGCPFNCDPREDEEHCADCESLLQKEGKLARERARVPVVDLPLGATEDRVTGSINIERALGEGVKAFDAGLLARANRGFLYIDEVNLLEDHLVDLLLDVSVTGRNKVEREGVSIEHPAHFVLVGSGNPEEGELRPQLQDRFGLSVEVITPADVEGRVRVVELMEDFERDPETVLAAFEKEQEKLRRRIRRGQINFPRTKIPGNILRGIAELCQRLGVHGHRGEITIARAARALAAFEGRREVAESDVRRVALMSLRHRLRRDPLERSGSGDARIQKEMEQAFQDAERNETVERMKSEQVESGSYHSGQNGTNDNRDGGVNGLGKNRELNGGANKGKELNAPVEAVDSELQENSFDNDFPSRGKESSGRKSRRHMQARQSMDDRRGGRYSRAVSQRPAHARIALDATVRAFAATSLGKSLRAQDEEAHALLVPLSALRYKRYSRKVGTLFIFAVDASGSMALNRIRRAKGALAELLKRSYIARDRVAIVAFSGETAETLLGPSQSITRARSVLDALPVGGATPLSAGLQESLNIASRSRQQSAQKVTLLLFTDGRANIPLRVPSDDSRAARNRQIDEEIAELGVELFRAGVGVVLVDTNNRSAKNSEAARLAERLNARYVHLPAMSSNVE